MPQLLQTCSHFGSQLVGQCRRPLLCISHVSSRGSFADCASELRKLQHSRQQVLELPQAALEAGDARPKLRRQRRSRRGGTRVRDRPSLVRLAGSSLTFALRRLLSGRLEDLADPGRERLLASIDPKPELPANVVQGQTARGALGLELPSSLLPQALVQPLPSPLLCFLELRPLWSSGLLNDLAHARLVGDRLHDVGPLHNVGRLLLQLVDGGLQLPLPAHRGVLYNLLHLVHMLLQLHLLRRGHLLQLRMHQLLLGFHPGLHCFEAFVHRLRLPICKLSNCLLRLACLTLKLSLRCPGVLLHLVLQSLKVLLLFPRTLA
mmetsp:Transcript_95635/g.309792  ORF Transcript_95635/g.309792 Transcript_95635/m.309792 type:complete len:320 (+) Transcript_95635:510-1469(+)